MANAEDAANGRQASEAADQPEPPDRPAGATPSAPAADAETPPPPAGATPSAPPPEAEAWPALDDANSSTQAPETGAPPSPGDADEGRHDHGRDGAWPDAESAPDVEAPPPPPPGDHDVHGGVESGAASPAAPTEEGGVAWEEFDATRDRASAQARDDWLRLVEEGWDARDTDVTRIGDPHLDHGASDLDDTGVADAALSDTFVDGAQSVAPTVDMPISPAAPPGEARPKLRRSRRRARHRGRVRRGLRVRQRLWAIDPWSVFKVSLLFYASVFLVVMVAGTLLWNVGRSSGTIERAEGFITGLGAYGECVDEADVPDDTDALSDADCADGQVRIDGFELDDGTIFRVAAIGGAVLVVAGSVGNVLMVVLLNLINEVTGGLRHTVVREPVRRPPTRSNDLDVGG